MKKMKKIVLSFVSIFMICLFMSCNNDIATPNYEEIQKEKFVQTFNSTFEVSASDYANHQWGMNTVPLVDISNTTRSADPRGNMWADEGYLVPDDISTDEYNAVMAVFNNVYTGENKSLVDWDCFFVQQVHKSTQTYTAGNGGQVVGANHMDYLFTITNKKEVVTCWWPLEKEIQIVEPYEDHVFDFNNSTSTDYGGRMLMVNSNTNTFGYHESESGMSYTYFRMEYIEPYGYFIGFDYSAEGQNSNQQVQRDYVYNDWIVKVTPGIGSVPPRPAVDYVRVMCEDLGSQTSDFDYNDIVFDIKFLKNGNKYYADILIQAAGGTLPLTIGGHEVHGLFGVSTTTMVNTAHGRHHEYAPIALTVELSKSNYETAWDAINDLPIIVEYNGVPIQLTINPGSPAEMIAVPVETDWSDERVPIYNNYPAFVDWIRDPNVQWWVTD